MSDQNTTGNVKSASSWEFDYPSGNMSLSTVIYQDDY